jgi:hypothetical protein
MSITLTCHVLRPDVTGATTFLVLPVGPVEVFGSKRAPLTVTVNGHIFQSRVQMYGGTARAVIRAEHRQAAGVEAGTSVRATFSVDAEPREVVVPDELTRALSRQKGATAAYNQLAYSHRKAWADHVASAVKVETRQRRATSAAERIARRERFD